MNKLTAKQKTLIIVMSIIMSGLVLITIVASTFDEYTINLNMDNNTLEAMKVIENVSNQQSEYQDNEANIPSYFINKEQEDEFVNRFK